ncbi:conjugative relaxase domain-containing protein, TrwC/TraI family [Micrococcales bacterium KH10]|nr:conjugative relaxase domain-containing protein, TrwC/TraI family [Micrococcales bacterium KH10]
MAMSLTRLTATGGVDYLMRTIASGDHTVTGERMTDYYLASGNPPGHWWGGGGVGAHIPVGEAVTAEGAHRLFKLFVHPVTGKPLGVAPRATKTSAPVAGFDCTFTIPKSIAVIWAVADRATQERIMAAHYRAIDYALEWIETNVAQTRSGKGGVAVEDVDGLIVARFNHYTSRDGDPHPHVHAVIANRVRRSRDGKWLTLDSRALHKAAVAASELHENMILDQVAGELGWSFVERETPEQTSKAVIMDVDGVPAEVIARFSSRDGAIKELQRELTAEFTSTYGRAPDRVERARIHRDAWRATRRAKDAEPEPLDHSMRRWRQQLSELGVSPRGLVRKIRRSRQAWIGQGQAGDHALTDHAAQLVIDQMIEQVADKLRAHADTTILTGSEIADDRAVIAAAALNATVIARATWSRANIRAEVERMTRSIRCPDPDARERLVDQITDRAISACVQLTDQRYHVVPDARLVTHDSSIFDDPSLRLFTHQRTLDAEAAIIDAAHRPFDPGVSREQATGLIDAAIAADINTGGHGLGDDQRTAAIGIIADPVALSVLVGPAGTGKTSTMREVRSAWEAAHGAGAVIGLTTSAQAAAVLADELGTETSTIAKWLNESIGAGAAARTNRIQKIEKLLTKAKQPTARAKLRRSLARQLAQQAKYRLHPGQLVIIDEASMSGTFPMAEIVRQASAAGAKVLLVGDPAQLGAPEAGGVLARLDRTTRTHHLTGVWRFANPWERDASLALRRGDENVINTYIKHNRLEHGSDEDMLEGAYQAALDDLAAGHDTLLIAGTNAAVRNLNTRFTLDRRAAGLVDTKRLATLRGGQDAGVGDVIVAREVDRQNKDTCGDFVRNGTLATVTKVGRDGSLVVRRHDNNATVTLNAKYTREATDLGYAMTAHRAQGSTVDRAHVAVPVGAMMPRELFYVAMTRGRHSNKAWVGEEVAEDGIVIDGTKSLIAEEDRLTYHMRLAAILQTSGAQRSATQVRDDEYERTHALSHLHAEREHLITLTRPPVDPELVDQALMIVNTRFGSAPRETNDADDAGASRRALANHLARLHTTTRRAMNDLIDEALTVRPTTGAHDLPALVHWRLTHLLKLEPTPGDIDVDKLRETDPHLAGAFETNQTLIEVRHQVLAGRPITEPWVKDLPDPEQIGAQTWSRLLLDVRVYRDRYTIHTRDPLGTPPDTRAKEQHAQWNQLSARLRGEEPPTTQDPTAQRQVQGSKTSDPKELAEQLHDKLTEILGTQTDEWFERVITTVLNSAKGKVATPAAYVLKVVASDPRRFKPTPTPERYVPEETGTPATPEQIRAIRAKIRKPAPAGTVGPTTKTRTTSATRF